MVIWHYIESVLYTAFLFAVCLDYYVRLCNCPCIRDILLTLEELCTFENKFTYDIESQPPHLLASGTVPEYRMAGTGTVSYTHLTLPTILLV